jgi:hypothetical protein
MRIVRTDPSEATGQGSLGPLLIWETIGTHPVKGKIELFSFPSFIVLSYLHIPPLSLHTFSMISVSQNHKMADILVTLLTSFQ